MPSVRLVAKKKASTPSKNVGPISLKTNVDKNDRRPYDKDHSKKHHIPTNALTENKDRSPSNTSTKKEDRSPSNTFTKKMDRSPSRVHPEQKNMIPSSKEPDERHRGSPRSAKRGSESVTPSDSYINGRGKKRPVEDVLQNNKRHSSFKQRNTHREENRYPSPGRTHHTFNQGSYPSYGHAQDNYDQQGVREKFTSKGFSSSDIDRILYYMKEEKARMETEGTGGKETKKANGAKEEKNAELSKHLSEAKELYEKDQRQYERMKEKYEVVKNSSESYENRARESRRKAQELINEYNRLRVKHKAALKQQALIAENTKRARQQSEKSKSRYDRLREEMSSTDADRNGTRGHQQIQININSSHYNHVEFHSETSAESRRGKQGTSSRYQEKYPTQNNNQSGAIIPRRG